MADHAIFGPAWQRQRGLLSPREQAALAGARVSVLGQGGVGGVAAELLVRAGVGRVSICDGDRFEASNLNRQVGATRDSLGRDKAEVMAERLRGINPELDLRVLPPVSDRASAERALAGAAAGVLAIDALAPSLRALRAARRLQVPLVEALALPVIQVRVFQPHGPDPEEGWPSQGQDLDQVDPERLAEAYTRLEAPRWRDGHGGAFTLEARAALAMAQGAAPPSLGPLVWMAGALAALETMKLIIGRGRLACYPGGAALDPAAWRLHFDG